MHQASPSRQLPTAAEPTPTPTPKAAPKAAEPTPTPTTTFDCEKFWEEVFEAAQDDAAPQCDAVGLYIYIASWLAS